MLCRLWVILMQKPERSAFDRDSYHSFRRVFFKAYEAEGHIMALSQYTA